MARTVEIKENELEKTRSFVRKNWPLALGIAGAAGILGAAVWLTARYLRESKKREKDYDEALEMVENEVRVSSSQSAALLDSGSYLGKISGQEGRQAIYDLANSTETAESRQAFEVLQEVIKMEKK